MVEHGRAVQAMIAAAVAGMLAACGGSQTVSQPELDTPGSEVATSMEGDVRSRLAAGLAEISPARASLVGSDTTTVTPVPADWLDGWEMLDVVAMLPANPMRFYAALSQDGTVVQLSGQPSEFNAVVAESGVEVSDQQVAQDVAAAYLDTTRSFERYAYRISSVEEINWLSNGDAEANARKEAVDMLPVAAPTVVESGDGWSMSMWMVDGVELQRRDLTVASDGRVVRDVATTVAEDLPVPTSGNA